MREQIARQRRRAVGNPNWPPGVSGNPRGAALVKERRQAVEAALLAELGGIELDALDQALVRRAVEALLRKPHDDNQRVRLLNVANRIVQQIRERHAPKRAVDELLEVGLLR